MFDRKFYTTNVIHDYSEVSNQMQLDRESREEIAKRELKVRDRVDISLDEYESMKDEIKRLQSELRCANNKLEKFGVAANLNAIPSTINIVFADSVFLNPFEDKLRCAIYFDFIPEEGMRLEDYCWLQEQRF